MFRKYILIVLSGLLIAGCGTTAPSLVSANVREAQLEATRIVADAQKEATTLAQNSVAVATEIPTDTPATEIPTEVMIETEEATATEEILPTEEVIVTEVTEEVTPTEEAVATEESSVAEEDSTEAQSTAALLVSLSDPVRGEELYQAFQADAGFACSTCHRPDTEDRLIGPGLLNVGQRAEIRVDGEDAATYLYNSIVNPDLYLVDDFADNLMPENWNDIYSDAEIYDIVAYLLTLEGESDSADGGDAMIAAVEIPFSELPDTADAEHGAELFQTFQPDAGFACSTCHWSDREDRLIGPGLLNVSVRAETRVDGQNSFEYLYTSILSPDSYLVSDFPDDLMPENWAEIYSDDDIYDIIAYLYTLTD